MEALSIISVLLAVLGLTGCALLFIAFKVVNRYERDDPESQRAESLPPIETKET